MCVYVGFSEKIICFCLCHAGRFALHRPITPSSLSPALAWRVENDGRLIMHESSEILVLTHCTCVICSMQFPEAKKVPSYGSCFSVIPVTCVLRVICANFLKLLWVRNSASPFLPYLRLSSLPPPLLLISFIPTLPHGHVYSVWAGELLSSSAGPSGGRPPNDIIFWCFLAEKCFR